MKATKFKRFLSILLVTVMVVSMMPLNTISVDLDFDGINSLFDDLVWGLVKESINPTVSAEGLPEGAEAELDVVSDPFAVKTRGAKSGSSQPAGFGEFLDFYDIKAVDKETGEELHPQGEVTVNIKNARIKEDQSVYLIHVLDNENVIKNAENLTIVTDSAFVRAFPDASAAAEAALGVSGVVAVEIIKDIDQKGRDLTFKTSSFSIFVIANNPRLNVRFYNGDELVSTIVVKYADRNSLDTLIYDQPIDTSNTEGIMFRGWTTDPDYVNPDTALTIKQVRTTVQTYLNNTEGNFEDNTNLDFYAMLYKQFVVSYFDERGVVCLGRDTFLYRADGADGKIASDGTIDYRINMSYLPSNEGQAFLGWTINRGRNLAGEGEEPEYEYDDYRENLVSVKPEGSDTYTTTIPSIIDNPIPAKIKGDIYLKAVAPVGNWLVFEENGKGAKYNAPQFVETNQPTQRPCLDSEMTRLGYTFGGWYYFPNDNAPAAVNGVVDLTNATTFTFGGTINKKTTVYAKWNAVATAPYTVIIWKQNINGDTDKTKYDFVESLRLTGNVGTNVNTISQRDSGDNAYARINGIDYNNYTGFHLREFDTNIQINPEGNTVVNVYYDRTEYTLSFQIYDYTYTVSTNDNDNNPEKYGDVNGQKARVYWNNGAFRTSNSWYGTVYTGTVYTRSNNRSWHSIKDITALYEQNISGNFPIVGTNGVTYNNGERWDPQSNTPYSEVLVYIDVMPSANVTFHLDEANRPLKTMNWYVEALPGDTNTVSAPNTLYAKANNAVVSANGKRFVLYKSISARYNGVTPDEDFIDLIGFTSLGADSRWQTRNGTKFYIYDEYNNGTVNFYYTRDRFDITYFDGGYFDGNGNPIDEVLQGRFDTEYGKQILYNDDIINYNKSGTVIGEGDSARTSNGTKYYVPEREGYVFEGWYIDDACTHPYTFNTMSGAIKVYAKWRQIQYRVFLIPDTSVGEGKTASQVVTVDPENGLWGTQSQVLNFRIDYGGKVSLPTGIDTNHVYEFGGWYLDPEYKHPFSGNEKLNESLSDYFKEYTKTGESADNTDEMDEWGHGATWNSDAQDDQGNPRDRFWITEKLELYALWRRVLDGADGVKVIYDYATGEVDDETPSTYSSTSTIAFSDNHIYEDRALSYGAAAPAPITVGEGEDAVTYYFRYWVRQEWVGEYEGAYYPNVILGEEPLVSNSRKIYPGESFRVDSQYARRINHGETSEYFVRFIAVYTEAEPPKVPVIYDANGGDWDDSTIITVTAYTDTDNTPVKYEAQDSEGKQYGFEIEINKEFVILENNDYLTRTGYAFLGWAFDKDMTASAFISQLETETASGYTGDRTVFAGGEGGVAADTLDTPNSSANTLYAIWDIAMIPVTIKKVLPEEGDTARAGDDTFTIDLSLAAEIAGRGIEDENGNTVSSLTLAADGPATVYVPYGSTLTVSENLTGSAKYEQTSTPYTTENVHNTDITGSNGTYTITGTDGVNAGTITVNNRVKDYVVTVKKTVPADVTFPEGTKFPFTCSTNLIEGGQFELGPNETKTFENRIKYGDKVSVSETANANVYTATSVLVNGAEYTQGAEHTVINDTNFEFTNNIVYHPVTVTKNVESIDPADTDGTNKFTINVVNATGTTIETLTLANGQKNTDINKAISLAYGTRFKVEENPGDNYTVEITGATADANGYYTVEGPIDIVVKNTRKTVDVTVTKTIKNDIAATDFKDTVEFSFTVDAPGVENDDASFKLKHGGEKTITVPMGAQVTITEAPADNFTASYKLNGGDKVDGSSVTFIASGNNIVAHESDGVTTYTAAVDFTNTRDNVEVEIIKLVDLDRDADKTFKFNVYVDNVLTFENVEVTSVQKDAANPTGVKKTVPYGSVVRVEEVTDETYYNEGHTVAEIFTTTLPDPVTAKTGSEKLVTLNERKAATIIIEKVIENEAAAADYANTIFNFTSNSWSGNKGISTQTAKAERTITVPYGTTVTIEEAENTLFTTTNTSPVSGDTTGRKAELTPYADETTVTFTNTRKPVTIKVVKVLENKGVDDDLWRNFEFPITYTIGENSTTIGVKPGETGATFEAEYGVTVTVSEDATKTVENRTYNIHGENGPFNVTITNATVTANDETPVITVTNTRKVVKVTVKKTVSIDDTTVTYDQMRDSFTFTPGISNGTYNVGSAFTLQHDGSKEFAEVPYGATFTVTEAGNAAYNTTFKIDNGEAASNDTNKAEVTLTKDTVITFNNERKTVTVTVTKELVPIAEGKPILGSDKVRAYTFDYEYVDGTGDTKETVSSNKSIPLTRVSDVLYRGSFTVKVPYGASFSATETNVDGFTVDAKTKSINSVTDTDNSLTFTNKRNVFDIVIEKTVDSEVAADKTTYYFNYSYKHEGNTVSDTISIDASSGNGNGRIENVPTLITDLVITENLTSDYIKTYVNGTESTDRKYSSGTTALNPANGVLTVTFENVRPNVNVKIEKQIISLDAADLDDEFEFTVTANGVTTTVKVKEGVSTPESVSVPVGVKVDIAETSDTTGYTTYIGTVADANKGKTTSFDPITTDQTVKFINSRNPLTFKITKTLDNLGMSDYWNGSEYGGFPIQYTITEGNGTPYSDIVYLKCNGTNTASSDYIPIPYGAKLEIMESVGDGTGENDIATYFSTTYENATIVNYTNDKTEVKVNNVRLTVPVTVTKKVASSIDADKAATYKFTVATNSTSAAYASQNVEIVGSGTATTNTSGNTILVPKGANVTVTETNADTTVFTVEYKIGENSYTTGTAQSVQKVMAETDFEFRNTRKEFDLTISKTVENFSESGDNVYPVNYAITYGEQNVASATLNFKAADDEQGIRNPTTIKVPYGCKVVVSENTAATVTINGTSYSIADAFDTKINNVETTSHTISSMTKAETVSVVNTRKNVNVTVHKVVVNNVWGIEADKTASFTIKINGTDETFTLVNNAAEKTYPVPYGESFTATETADPAFNTKVGFAQNSLGTGNTKTITAVTKNSEHDIWFENTRKEITVTVHKIVTNPSEMDDSFQFAATLKFVTEAGTQTLNFKNTGDASFSLQDYATHNNQEKVITIPYGATVSVKEDNYAPRYSSTSTIKIGEASKTDYNQGDVTLTADALIEVTNDRKWIYIPVSKVVESNGATADANIEFSFTWKYTTTEGTTTGTTALVLKGGDTEPEVVRVPIGSKVTVTEDDISLADYGYNGKKVSDIFTTTNDHGTGMVATITDVQAMNGETAVDNTITFTNTHNQVDVNLQKIVDQNADKEKVFTFTYSGIGNSVTKTNVTCTHKEGSKLLVTIPVGTGIEISETSETGFSTTADIVVGGTTQSNVLSEGKVTLSAVYDATTVVFNNTRDVVKVTITKQVVDKGITADKNIGFRFTASATLKDPQGNDIAVVLNDDDSEFTLKDGQFWDIEVPYGSTVTVDEDTAQALTEYNGAAVSTVFATSEANNKFSNVTTKVSAIVKNTHRDVTVDVIKVVEGLDLDKDIDFEFSASAVRGNDTAALADADKSFKLNGFAGDDEHEATNVHKITIPYGTTLTVTEKTENTLNEYNGSKVSEVFTVKNASTVLENVTDSTKKVTVTNTHNTVTVEANKTVVGIAGVDDQIEFPFSVEIKVGTTDVTDEVMTMTDDVKSFTLIGDTTENANKKEYTVPYGTTVTFTEDVTKELSIYGNHPISDVFTTEAASPLTNVKGGEEAAFKNTHKTVTVAVIKTVESEDNSDHTKPFKFNASAKVGDVETLTADDLEFYLQDFNTSETLGKRDITVYYGTLFSVDEDLEDEASKYIVTVNGEKSFVAYADTTTVTFNNKRAAGDLTITKTVTGKTTSDAFVFKITKAVAEGEEPFEPLYVTIHPETGKNGNGFGSVTIKQLEAGTYTVEELDNWSWAYVVDENDEKQKSATIVGGDTQTVDFTNAEKDTNWLRDESARENNFEDVTPTVSTEKGTAAMAWDSKFWLAYAASAGRFGDDKEIA